MQWLKQFKRCKKQKTEHVLHFKMRLTIVLFWLALSPSAFGNRIIFVDDDTIGNNDGSSWQSAYTSLQEALTDAEGADKPIEICVAQGIYKPYNGSWEKSTDSTVSFQLINEVTIVGGYAGFGEQDPNTRNVELYETILSGDLNGNDVDVNDPCDMLLVQFNRGDNSDHVVKGSNTDASAILDGFTITGGHLMAVSMGSPTGGAGMYIASGSPTIINCIFTGNAASQAGGGMYNIAGSPMLIDCKFEKNYAEFGAGIYNSTTMYLPQRSKPILINCSFNDNYSGREGGGMYNSKSDPNLTNCAFIHNFSLVYGAGIYNSYSSIELIDTSFIENTAGSGGGIYSEDNSNLIVKNCTFKNNIAKAVFGGGICNEDANELILTNCTFSGNTAMRDGGGIFNRRTSSTLMNCIITGNKAYGELLYTGEGGGLYAFGDTILNNCTFSGNWAHQGRAISKYSDSFLRL
ncbi:MAG: right-handed parallel beta-helix repeat-containing protein, partial [Planctomycetota bacterium]